MSPHGPWQCPGLSVCKDRPAAGSRGDGAMSVQRRWDIVCSEEVGHCLFRGDGAMSVQRRWGNVCSEEVGHCLFRLGGAMSVPLRSHTSLTASHQCSAISSCWSLLGRLRDVAD